jgi:hypothetical protein
LLSATQQKERKKKKKERRKKKAMKSWPPFERGTITRTEDCVNNLVDDKPT